MAEKEKIELEQDGPFTTRLLEAVREEIKLFHDQDNIGYAALRQDGHSEIYRIASREFSNYLSLVAWKKFKKAPMANTKEMITSTIEAMAKFEGQERELHVRTAWIDGVLWYDLGGKAVKVTADGWAVVDDPPIIFKRFQHQREQVEPTEGGSLDEILRFINLPDDPERIKMMTTLLLTYLVAVLIPVVPRPIIIVHGTPGAAKSTFFRLIKSLVDPSTLDTMTYPRDTVQLIQMLSHHYMICFDNMSDLTNWQSDELCKACTGQAFSKRMLFSDDDDVTYNYKVAIGLNGINIAATRPDLLDRSLIFELPTIPEEKRRSEEELRHQFAEAKPRILGAMFTALAKAIGFMQRKEVTLTNKPRLADYATWASASALGIGKSIDDFLTAYKANVENQNAEALETSSIGQVIEHHIIFCNHSELEGDSKHVYDILSETAETLGLGKAKDFPRDHRWLWRKIKPIKQNLEGIGVAVEYFEKLRPRKIVFRNLKMGKVVAGGNVKNTGDDGGNVQGNQNLPLSSSSPDNMTRRTSEDDFWTQQYIDRLEREKEAKEAEEAEKMYRAERYGGKGKKGVRPQKTSPSVEQSDESEVESDDTKESDW